MRPTNPPSFWRSKIAETPLLTAPRRRGGGHLNICSAPTCRATPQALMVRSLRSKRLEPRGRLRRARGLRPTNPPSFERRLWRLLRRRGWGHLQVCMTPHSPRRPRALMVRSLRSKRLEPRGRPRRARSMRPTNPPSFETPPLAAPQEEGLRIADDRALSRRRIASSPKCQTYTARWPP